MFPFSFIFVVFQSDWTVRQDFHYLLWPLPMIIFQILFSIGAIESDKFIEFYLNKNYDHRESMRSTYHA